MHAHAASVIARSPTRLTPENAVATGSPDPRDGFRPKPSPDHSGVRLVANCSRSCCCAVNMRRPLRKRLHDAAASGRRIWAEAGRRACGGGTRQTAVRVCDRGLAVPAGWTRLAQPQQFTGKLFTSFRGRKIPRLRGRRRSFGPSRSFHGPSCEGIQRQEGRARQETIAPRIRAF